MAKTIFLSKGCEAIVDAEDYDWLMQWKWSTLTKNNNKFYAVRTRSVKEKSNIRTLKMHRAILNPPEGFEIDHINGNGLDNRRCNLRICTGSQNSMNKKKRKNCLSKYKGVSLDKRKNKWMSYIKINYKNKFLGYFHAEIKAAIAYNEAAKQYFGEFANINNLENTNAET